MMLFSDFEHVNNLGKNVLRNTKFIIGVVKGLIVQLTAGDERVPQHRANVTFGSIDSSP